MKSKFTIKTIVFFTNPFGYGPTGSLLPVISEFTKQKYKKVKLILATSNFCKEIIDWKKINNASFILINERSIKSIVKLLESLPNPHVVSSLNRFALQATSNMKVPSAFIDTLSWFWDKIPEQYFLADFYFALKTASKYLKYPKNTIFTSPILGEIPKELSLKRKKLKTINIGGINNPLFQKLPTFYLKILAFLLNNLDFNCPVLVTGGQKALSYLKIYLKNKNIKLATLPRRQFINKLSQSESLLTTAGINTTFEGFALNVPVSFILPTNLSQWALMKKLERAEISPRRLMWEDYLEINKNFKKLTEHDALYLIHQYSQIIYNNKKILNKLLKDFVNVFHNSNFNNNKQKAYIDKIGINGEKEIVSFLANAWKL